MTDYPIVVGIDGAADCENAIRWATTEAAARGTGLRLVHAFVWPEFPVPLGPSDVAPGLRAYADKIVADALELATKLAPDLPITAERVDGFPSPVLLRESRTADLLVIGSRGLGGALGMLVGSTGTDLAAHAHCPVVIIRPEEAVDQGRRVVIGYDGSPAAGAALDFGLAHARRHHVDARVVAVHSPHEDHQRVTQHDLARAVQSRQTGPVAELIHVTGHPAEELLSWSTDARLLVVGARGRGGFTGMLLGSVSQTVLRQAQCPVAVIPRSAVQAT
ncbi:MULTISPECIES: universal stress protein [unclassified Kribbella]|uniref:universal stress protein n=1 Tax=unclassified Kribbella TaxID=2644121 RepID=UPI00301AAF84